MATLVVRGPDGFNEEKEVSGELSIGRADTCDLILTSGGVSRRHARVFVDDGKVLVEDTGSANGTFVDGNKIKGAQPLTNTVKVVIGDYELSLKAAAGAGAPKKPSSGSKSKPPVRGGAAAPGASNGVRDGAPVLGGSGAPPTRTLARSGKPMTDAALLTKDKSERQKARAAAQAAGTAPRIDGPQLRGMTGPWAGKTFPIRAKMTVGRVAGVTLQLDDDSVSRKHAELEPSDDGVVLRDLASANGTAVNGVPVTDEVALYPGDVVQFGVVELEFLDAEEKYRRTDSGGPQLSGGRRKLILIGSAALVVLLLGGFALKMTGAKKPVATAPPKGSPMALVDSAQAIEELLNTCRSYASTELGSEPNWDKAEQQCNKALDLDPINSEANELIRRIKFEQENFTHYTNAERDMKLGREEEAVDEFSKIGEGSIYYMRVKARIADAVSQTLRRNKDECDRYTRNNEYRAALVPCENYMKFRCQAMTRDELYPPPGFKMRIDDAGFVKKNEWRPGEPMYRKFLRVRQRMDPQAPQWDCPVMTIVRQQKREEQPGERVEKVLKAKYADKLMQNALLLYWYGRDNEANQAFLKIVEDVNKADLHRQSEEMRRDCNAVASFFKAGQTSLQADDVENAAKSFEEAWNLDMKLMGDLAEKEPSFWRQQIGGDLAEKSYDKGKYYADRQDPVRACKIWKTAFHFYKGNTSINKAIGFCSGEALRIFQGANSCDDLRTAIQYAVEGDGIAEKAAQRRGELGCAGPAN